MRQTLASLLIVLVLTACATPGKQQYTVHGKPYGEKQKDSVSVSDVVGGIVIGIPAAVFHGFWTVWGAIWGYPLAALEGDEEQVKSWWTVQAGPTYVSTRFASHWAYYGNEPEEAMAAFTVLPGRHMPKVEPLLDIEVDRTWAIFRPAGPGVNMRGDERRPLVEEEKQKQ
jgi:hypothetical protein